MLGKNNIFSGLLTVIILAIVIFFGIYFLYPDVSMKYFGMAARPNVVLSSAMEEYLDSSSYLSQEEKEAVASYFDSEEGKKVFAAVSEAASKGGNSLEKTLQSPEFKDFTEKVGSAVNKDSLEKLVKGISSEASRIYSKVSK